MEKKTEVYDEARAEKSGQAFQDEVELDMKHQLGGMHFKYLNQKGVKKEGHGDLVPPVFTLKDTMAQGLKASPFLVFGLGKVQAGTYPPHAKGMIQVVDSKGGHVPSATTSLKSVRGEWKIVRWAEIQDGRTELGGKLSSWWLSDCPTLVRDIVDTWIDEE